MWLWFSLAAGFFRTVKDIQFKDILSEANSVEALFCFYIFMAIFIAPVAFWHWKNKNKKGESVCVSPKTALLAVTASGLVNVAAYYIFMESLRASEFSTSTALRNLVPMFALFFGVKVLKEKIGPMLIFGTTLVVLGVVLVHSQEGFGFTEMIYSIATKPSLLAILSAAMFAGCATFDRWGTAKTFGGLDSVIYTATLFSFVAFGYAILNLILGSMNEAVSLIQMYWDKLLFVGLFGALGGFFTIKAFSVGEIIKVVPALRSQVLFSVIIGGLYFEESSLVLKIVGGAVLVLGIALIAMPPKKLKSQD